MNCKDVDTIWNEHRRESLGSSERRALEAHLARCSRCAEQTWVYALIRADVPPRPEDAMFDRIAAAVARDTMKVPRTPAVGRYVEVAGLAAVLAVAVIALAFVSRVGWQRGTDVPPRVAESDGIDGARDGVTAERQIDAAVTGVAGAFVEGRDYLRIAPPTAVPSGTDVEVAVVFMYHCFPCFSFEPYLEAWSQTHKGDVSVVRVPVAWNATARLHARAHYAARHLGLESELHRALLDEIHMRGNLPATEAALVVLFGRLGIERDRFLEVFESPAVAADAARGETLVARYGVTATPTIVVDGRYVTTGAMAGSYERWFAIIDALIRQERDGVQPDNAGADVRER